MSRTRLGISFVAMIASLWVLVGACSTPPATPTPTAVKFFDLVELTAGRPPSYEGISPGVSTKHDVLNRWGEPNVIRTHGAFESLHYFGESTQEFFLVKDGIVQAVTSDAILEEQIWREGYTSVMEDLDRALGPHQEITTTLFEGSVSMFPAYGLAVSGPVCQLFDPTSQPEYQTLWGWGKLRLAYDPFPLIPSVDTVGITPGQTTRAQVAQLLGNPDRIVYEDPGVSWLYYVEPDLLRWLFVFFDMDDQVTGMAISEGYASRQVPRLAHLEETVKQYGAPEGLLLVTGEGGKYEIQVILYPTRGLWVAVMCPTPDCNTVTRDSIISRKVYFPPQTLAEYQTEYRNQRPDSGSAFIEWPGFSE